MRVSPAANGPASWRGRASLFAVAGLVTLGASTCALNQQGVAPPLDRISFPGSALADPDGRWLYIANSNADLRYNNGTLVALDLQAAAIDRDARWQVCPGADYVRADADPAPCCWDFLDHSILDCDERKYIPQDSTIEIGSFSAGMVFQSFTEPKCTAGAASDAANAMTPQDRHDCHTHCPGDSLDGRLFIGVRGDSSLTYVNTTRVTDPELGTRPHFSTCPAVGPLSACRVVNMPGPTFPMDTGPAVNPTPVPDEPYALAINPSQDLLYVGHLRGDTSHPGTGGVSLFDVSRVTGDLSGSDNLPVYLGSSGSLFGADANGNFGVTSLTLRGAQIYASSRYTTSVVDVIPSLGAPSCTAPQAPATATTLTLSGGSDVYSSPLVGAEIRGIQFLPNNRAFVLQRTPPALIGFDMSNAPTGSPNFPSDILETCTSPTFLQSYDAGEGPRLYVTCFDAGQIYVFDPSIPRLVTVIDSGRGPAGLAFASSAPTAKAPSGQKLAFIVGFTLNDVAVLDLTPGSITQYHVIQRFGFPSLVPR